MTQKRPNPYYVEALKKLVNESGFPRHCGFALEEIDLKYCRFRLPIGPQHLQPFNILHGGNIATLIDTVTFWSVFFSLEDQTTGLVNIDLKLNYLKTATSGTLSAVGKQIRAGRTILYAEGFVYDGSGDLLAHGTSTLMSLPGKGLPISIPKFIELE